MFLGTFMVQAQQKNFINYQGVARNSENELMEQETLNIGIALKFGSADATDQYKESHSVTTDANGVFNLQIGSGVSNGGSYANLPWGDAVFVTVSFNGAEVGTTELMAVPFAIASGDNVWKANGNDIENKNVGEVKIKSDLRILGGFNLNSGNQVNEISDDGALVENSNGILPTQRAVKTYVDNRLFSGGGDAQIASEVPYDNTDSGLTADNVQDALDEFVSTSGGGSDADADPTNELQDISLLGTDLSITDGSTIDLSAIIPPGGTDDQNASEVPFDNTGTGLAAGDTQAAIEELASGGLVDTDDQNLSLSGTLLEITDGTGVDLSAIIPPGGTDDQNASEVPFDNTGTGLAAGDTQAAIEELASGGLVDTDDQNLSLSGTLLEITDGTGVDLSAIIPPGGTDDQNAAEVSYDNVASGLAATDAQAAIDELATSGVVDTDDQALILTGDVLTIEDGLGSIDLSAYKDAPDLTTQTGLLQGDGTTISGLVGTADNQVAKWNNATNTWAAGTDETGGLALPYYDETSLDNGAAFHTHNTATAGRYGIAGSAGIGAEILPSNSAGVLGHGAGAHGVYGVSENNFWAGVQGVSNSVNGVGVQGYAFGGGVGGHFYTTTTGVAALTTGRGNVGIGIDEPEMKMHVGGDLFVQTDLGELVMGFPENGNQWQFSTLGAGADLQFDSKPIGSNVFDTRFRMRQGGEFQVGDISSISAWAHIRNNSTIIKPNLKLEEEGNDFARLELTNNASGGAFWHVAGLPSSTAANAKLNFYFRNASGGGDRMTITGNGQVGINTSNPSARLTINQAGQEVGTGLSFRDGTANKDWHITHGFALMFHYGDELRGFINANTGAYTSASDKRLKSEIRELPDVLERVSLLKPSSYIFKADKSRTRAIGFVAQEVQPLFPELVSESGDDDILGVNYAGFSVVAIRAIQKQQEIISEQSRMISKLEERLQRLEAVITK